MKAIGVTGMPGAGKSEAVAVARARDLPVVRMGDLIWEEVERQGLPREAQHVGRVANEMRKSQGNDVWALRTVERVRDLDAALVIIDGVRSNHEVEVFRRELGDEFELLAIYTDRDERFRRMTARARDDDPHDAAAHEDRDDRELGWGIARTIALADHMIVNDSDLETFRGRVAAFLDDVLAA